LFSLLVAGSEGAWDGDTIAFGMDRFTYQTEDHLAKKFKTFSFGRSVLRFARNIEAMPALVGYEASLGYDFELAYLRDVRQDGSDILFSIEPTGKTVPLRLIESNSAFFQPSGFGLNQTHWAIKPGDLISFLQANGIGIVSPPPLPPAMPRPLALNGAMMLQTLSHTALDSFLLELDVPELQAPQSEGSRQDRANAIARFVADFPDALTLSGLRLDTAIVLRAIKADPSYPDGDLIDIDKDLRERFWNGARASGMLAAAPDPVPLAPLHHATVIAEEISSLLAQSSRPVPAAPSPSRLSTAALEAGAHALPSEPAKVFIVHGRDVNLKLEVDNFLRRIGLEPVILHEQPNGGRHLLTKFIEVAKTCDFAIALLAEEDEGEYRGVTPLQGRARQNVVLELGYFLALLGPERTMGLKKGTIEEPSDYQGVVYTSHAGDWRSEIARELHAAGISFNHTAVFQR
jgi:hypothetical protein